MSVSRESRKKRKQSRRNSNVHLNFQELESRRLLAGFYLDPASGDFTVIGDAENNTAQVSMQNGNLLRATIDNQVRDVNVFQVSRVVFVGFGGDDRFTNNTGIASVLYGHDGDDVLNGGTGVDIINGGAGIDEIFGNNGDDFLVGAAGDDQISGWQGNDRIFGGAGMNELHGDGGDDQIFGGNDDDMIFGGAGIDKIYGLAGDDTINSGSGGVPNTTGTQFADLVLGLEGDDTIIGGGGLDVFWGGNGNDTLVGGGGENRLHGQFGNDQITGGSFGDYLAGHAGNDVIQGLNGNDYIYGGSGFDTLRGGNGNDNIDGGSEDDNLFGDNGNDFLNGGIGDDTVDGGAGVDTAIYARNASNYRVTGQVFQLNVHDKSGFDGTNSVNTMEVLRFADGDKTARPSANEVVRIQPIIVANDDGSNRAEFMGNDSQAADIQAQIDDIFAQADVDIQWLAPRQWNNTFANVGNGGRRDNGHLNQIVSSGDSVGAGNADALVLDMYFVEVVPGFRDVGENTANGLAFIDSNGITAHVGDNLVDSNNGRRVAARVLAHEIAHNLGLTHVNDPSNLMDEGTLLTASQGQTILDSRFSRG